MASWTGYTFNSYNIILQADEGELQKTLQTSNTWQNTMDHHLLNIPGLLTKFRGLMALKRN